MPYELPHSPMVSPLGSAQAVPAVQRAAKPLTKRSTADCRRAVVGSRRMVRSTATKRGAWAGVMVVTAKTYHANRA